MSAASSSWSGGWKKEAVAQIGTVLIALFLFYLSQTMVMKHDVVIPKKELIITLISPPPEPKKIITQPIKKVIPPKPKKIVHPPKLIKPPIVAPPVAEQVLVPVVPIEPVEKTEEIPPTPVEPVEPVEPVVQRASNGAAEGMFVKDVRIRIERKKIYPEVARNLGMTGEVEVQYRLDRTGTLLSAEVVSSSGFKLLDKASLRAVKSATYKPFPEDAWPRESSKVFRTKLVFSIDE